METNQEQIRDDLRAELVKALRAEHLACDWLMARLIVLDPNFRATESPIWPLIRRGSAALLKAGAMA